MSSVEWASSSELTTGGSRRGARWSRDVTDRVSRLSDVQARRLAAGGLLVTFVLVLVSQWEPWFSLVPGNSDNGFDPPTTGDRSIGAMTALYNLADPYYLGWSLIGIAAVTAVVGRRRFRRTAAGVAAGAIAGQTIVVVAIWHDNGVGFFRSVLGDPGGIQGHREIGFYLALAAVVMAAASMVVAVRGRILPSLHDDDNDSPTALDRPTTAANPSHREELDEERPRLGAPVVESTEALEDEPIGVRLNGSVPDARSDGADHSIYMRPRGADARR